MEASVASGGAGTQQGVAIYAPPIFTGAFLLFLVQPVLARSILPWFGGSAGVWSIALLFFQTVLLLGYLYAFFLVRLPSRVQACLHLVLLVLSLALLPIVPAAAWKPAPDADPASRILGLLAVSAGLPYFLLSTTSPLLQAWYARSRRVSFPYRFFALSNLGSLIALLAYPVVVEPLVTVRGQLQAWSWAYGIFVLLCAAAVADAARTPASAPAPDGTDPSAIPLREYVVWMALAACGSALLLAVTSHLSENVAPVPLLWVVPLSAYLLSFILAFDRAGWYTPAVFRWLLPPAVAVLAFAISSPGAAMTLHVALPLLAAALFVCCLFCHGELARRKPDARQLTSFYLMVALGGALGSLFAGLAAPRLFNWPLEFPAAVGLCVLLSLPVLYRRTSPALLVRAGLLMVIALAGSERVRAHLAGTSFSARNFYGTISVGDLDPADPLRAARALYHGSIVHGVEYLGAARESEPASYYGRQSGIGQALEACRRPHRRIGIVGLGTGTLAAYGRAGDEFRFYEINPLVIRAASSHFRFLSRSSARIEIVPGDARLSLAREPSQSFDLLVVDAFSGDSIPVHLLTREAFNLYFRHLNGSGVLALHITNRYVKLEPLLAEMAADARAEAVIVRSPSEPRHIFSAQWVLMARSHDALAALRPPNAESLPKPLPGLRPWTDDYSNIWAVLR